LTPDMPQERVTWSGSLHQTFRLVPEPSKNLKPFLEADGLTPDELLRLLPYDRARAGGSERELPDPKRYRDGKQVYETIGLLYEDEGGRVRVTRLGAATRRFMNVINAPNAVILGRHAAYALAACQLRNPTGAGKKYDASMRVFPFAFIWRAMLALEGKLSSEELNRALMRVRDETDLARAIGLIRDSRVSGAPEAMGERVVETEPIEDRIIPWISMASFGWTLIQDKKGQDGTFYTIRPNAFEVVREASRIHHKHREFGSTAEYSEHVARWAGLPEDLR